MVFAQGQVACAEEKVSGSADAKPFVEAADYSAKYGGRAVLVQQSGKIAF
jgi:hypothetical protein